MWRWYLDANTVGLNNPVSNIYVIFSKVYGFQLQTYLSINSRLIIMLFSVQKRLVNYVQPIFSVALILFNNWKVFSRNLHFNGTK